MDQRIVNHIYSESHVLKYDLNKQKLILYYYFYSTILNFNLPDNERKFEKHYTPVIC